MKKLLILTLLLTTVTTYGAEILNSKSSNKIVVEQLQDALVVSLETDFGRIFERKISLSKIDSVLEIRSNNIKKGYRYNFAHYEDLYNDENADFPLRTPYGLLKEELDNGFSAGSIVMVPIMVFFDTILLPVSLTSRVLRGAAVKKDLKILKEVIESDSEAKVNPRRFARIVGYFKLVYDKYIKSRNKGLKIYWDNYRLYLEQRKI